MSAKRKATEAANLNNTDTKVQFFRETAKHIINNVKEGTVW